MPRELVHEFHIWLHYKGFDTRDYTEKHLDYATYILLNLKVTWLT